jgi:hypothetical protein
VPIDSPASADFETALSIERDCILHVAVVTGPDAGLIVDARVGIRTGKAIAQDRRPGVR